MSLKDNVIYLVVFFDYNKDEKTQMFKYYGSLTDVSLEDLKRKATFLKLLGIIIKPKDINVLTNPQSEIEAKIKTFGSEVFKEHPRWLNCSTIDIRRKIEEEKSLVTEYQPSTTTFKDVSANLDIIKSGMNKDKRPFRNKIEGAFGFDLDFESNGMGRAA